MQALSILSMSHSFRKFDDLDPVLERVDSNFDDEKQMNHDNKENVEEQQEFSFACIDHQGINHDHEENVEEQQQFSFVCIDNQAMLTFADEIFDNGQIRPTLPIVDKSFMFTTTHDNNNTLSLRPPLKKLFIEQLNDFSSKSNGLHDETLQNTTTMVEVVSSNDKPKKSNSMGFSKVWRFREDFKLRRNSYGNDVFVLLNNPSRTRPVKSNNTEQANVVSEKGNGGKHKTTLSAHEKLYVMNRKRTENDKRKSFLPYRKGLIGFFTNMNGFTKNS